MASIAPYFSIAMPPEPEPTRQSGAAPAALGLLAAGVSVYLAFALAQAGALAFPLDDAWIHQTYARTFAQNGEWAYRPGQPSSGSTAPLWTLLLALGYWLGAPP